MKPGVHQLDIIQHSFFYLVDVSYHLIFEVKEVLTELLTDQQNVTVVEYNMPRLFASL